MKPSEYLEQREWLQGKMWKCNSEGEIVGCCLLGLLTAGEGYDYLGFQEFCHKKFDKSIPYVNDKILTTKAEAVALLQEWEGTL